MFYILLKQFSDIIIILSKFILENIFHNIISSILRYKLLLLMYLIKNK